MKRFKDVPRKEVDSDYEKKKQKEKESALILRRKRREKIVSKEPKTKF